MSLSYGSLLVNRCIMYVLLLVPVLVTKAKTLHCAFNGSIPKIYIKKIKFILILIIVKNVLKLC